MIVSSLFSDTLEAFRQNINSATVTLASSFLMDEEATQDLLWVLQTTAQSAQEALPAEHDNSVSIEEYEQDDGFRIKPLRLQGTISEKANPLVFAHPSVVGRPRERNTTAASYLAGLCAVALYNTGLARHQQSLAPKIDEDMRSLLSNQAVEFYRKAHSLLDQIQNISPEGTLVNVYCAVCNNLVEVYTTQDNAQEVDFWQNALRECLLPVPPYEYSPIYQHFARVNLTYSVNLESFDTTHA